MDGLAGRLVSLHLPSSAFFVPLVSAFVTAPKRLAPTPPAPTPGEVPESVKRSVELWIGCMAGALQETEYRSLLAEVGFEEIEVEPTRIYRAEDALAFLQEAGIDPAGVEEVDGKVMSAFVRARKPGA